jgi:hypothetical protein
MKDVGTSSLIKGIDKEIAIVPPKIMVADSKLMILRYGGSKDTAV